MSDFPNYIHGDFINYMEEPLPRWATGKTSGNLMERGAQLCTRDGYCAGNGFVLEVYFDQWSKLPGAYVMTDMGNVMKLNMIEVHQYYSLGAYIMDTEEARRTRIPFRKKSRTELKALFRKHYSDEYLEYVVRKKFHSGRDITELLFTAFCTGHQGESDDKN